MKHAKLMICLLIAISLVATAFAGCEKSYKDKKAQLVEKKEKEIKDLQVKQDEKKADEAKAAKPAKSGICWGAEDAKAAPVAFEVGGKKFEITSNYRLKALDADAAKPLVIGVLTDIKNFIPANEKNLKEFYTTFKAKGVSVVVVAGDSSEKYDMMKPLFEMLAKQNLLTLVIMGNRDTRADFDKAMTEVGAQFKNLVNMNRIRFADLGVASVVSLAGYYDPNYIHNKPGCAYKQPQLDLVGKLAADAKNPVVLLSHGPPRGDGKDALDLAVEAGNVGDPKMAEMITKAKIPFGIFGNIHEAGGKAVAGDFKTLVKQGAKAGQLFLNPGPADSDPWNMNDGSISVGMAAVMTINPDKTASYEILRVKQEEK